MRTVTRVCRRAGAETPTQACIQGWGQVRILARDRMCGARVTCTFPSGARVTLMVPNPQQARARKSRTRTPSVHFECTTSVMTFISTPAAE